MEHVRLGGAGIQPLEDVLFAEALKLRDVDELDLVPLEPPPLTRRQVSEEPDGHGPPVGQVGVALGAQEAVAVVLGLELGLELLDGHRAGVELVRLRSGVYHFL